MWPRWSLRVDCMERVQALPSSLWFRCRWNRPKRPVTGAVSSLLVRTAEDERQKTIRAALAALAADGVSLPMLSSFDGSED